MATNRPKGKRILVSLTISGGGKAGPKDATPVEPNTVLMRMKSGTADFLGLKALAKLPEGKSTSGRKTYRRGSKGTKSFTLILKTATEIGGVTVKTLSLPVPSTLGVNEFYEYAYANLKTKIAGFITERGVSYLFDATAATP